MGAWGPKLYQDDIACEIKDSYIDLLKEGKSNEEAVKQMIAGFEDMVNDFDDGPIFWFALADIQWKYGRLLPIVKKQAIKYIKSGTDLNRWQDNKKLYEQRVKVLEELKDKLNSPQPPEKKIIIPKSYITDWEDGDVYAYKLESDYAKGNGLFGRYLILIKVGEEKSYPNSIVPIVKIKITKDDNISVEKNQIDGLDYIITGVANLGDYVYTHLNRKDISTYPKDENGFSLVHLMIMSDLYKKKDLNKFIYLGDFGLELKAPTIDCSPRLNTPYCYMKNFEENVLSHYSNYNLKKDEIYEPDFWEKYNRRMEEGKKRLEELFRENAENKKNKL